MFGLVHFNLSSIGFWYVCTVHTEQSSQKLLRILNFFRRVFIKIVKWCADPVINYKKRIKCGCFDCSPLNESPIIFFKHSKLCSNSTHICTFIFIFASTCHTRKRLLSLKFSITNTLCSLFVTKVVYAPLLMLFLHNNK